MKKHESKTIKVIKVFVVDDSAVVRQGFQQIFEADPGFEFLGAAQDPIFARPKLDKNWPDVIILDLEMPRMDGMTFLRNLMAERPTPVLICSTLTEKGAEASFKALSLGAVDYITKPKVGVKGFLSEYTDALKESVRGAALVGKRYENAPVPTSPTPAESEPMDVSGRNKVLIAMGASTGGTQALERILTSLPTDIPGIVIVQHMPEAFTAKFAERLNHLCKIEVKEAVSGEEVRPGLALIARGGRHLALGQGMSGNFCVVLKDGPPFNRHKPSVDVLFRSVARYAGSRSLGILLTGMGTDGAGGLLEMRNAGATTIAQDQATSIVYGMPQAAVQLGAAERILPLEKIAGAMIQAGMKT